MAIALDSNILIDVLGQSSEHTPHAVEALNTALSRGALVICPVVAAETSLYFATAEDTEATLKRMQIRLAPFGWRDLHHIIALLYDKSDPEQEKKADACYKDLVTTFGKKGWASYRTGVNSMELVAQQYGQTNRDFNKLLKNAIDPNGVIAPGKSGIA